MKKISYLVTIALASSILFSCGSSEEKTSETEKANTENTSSTAEMDEDSAEEQQPMMNVDSLVASINDYRKMIEGKIQDGEEISTENMRAKVRQKWSKMHFYTMDGNVVRIKTYPHESVSKRTEEFYLMDGNLVLSVIEDNGEGDRGKGSEAIDKMYYYHNDAIVKEVNEGEKAEYSIRESDAEELLSEVKEYLDVYNAAKKM
jgi:hypothetical protein